MVAEKRSRWNDPGVLHAPVCKILADNICGSIVSTFDGVHLVIVFAQFSKGPRGDSQSFGSSSGGVLIRDILL